MTDEILKKNPTHFVLDNIKMEPCILTNSYIT